MKKERAIPVNFRKRLKRFENEDGSVFDNRTIEDHLISIHHRIEANRTDEWKLPEYHYLEEGCWEIRIRKKISNKNEMVFLEFRDSTFGTELSYKEIIELFKSLIEHKLIEEGNIIEVALYYFEHFTQYDLNPVEIEYGEMVNGKKIKWLGTEEQLIFFMEQMYFNKLFKFNKGEIHSITAKHFVNKDGNPFNNKQLAKVKSNMDEDHELKDSKFRVIESITNLYTRIEDEEREEIQTPHSQNRSED